MRKGYFSLSILSFLIILIIVFPKEAHGADYYSSGTMTSTNLLSGLGVSGILAFGYNVSLLPTDTSVQVQFSQNLSTWYDSSGNENGWNNLLYGDRLDQTDAIDLTNLGWERAYFYYRVRFETEDPDATAVLDEVVIYYAEGSSAETERVSDVSPIFATANGDITGLSGGNATTRGFEYGLTETGTWACRSSSRIALSG